MNKKVLALIVAIVLLIAACIVAYGMHSNDTQPQEPIPTSTPAPTEAPAPEPTATPEPTPEIVPAGEPGLHEDGSITLDNGTEVPAGMAKGEYVPLDQVLTHVQVNYGNDALSTITELMNKHKFSKESLQLDLAKFTKEEMEKKWIPNYKEVLESVKWAEAEKENFDNNYNPNKIYEDTNY